MYVYNSLPKCTGINIATSIINSIFRFFLSLVSESFRENSNVSSIYFDMLARLCNVYLVLIKPSHKLSHYFRLSLFEVERR